MHHQGFCKTTDVVSSSLAVSPHSQTHLFSFAAIAATSRAGQHLNTSLSTIGSWEHDGAITDLQVGAASELGLGACCFGWTVCASAAVLDDACCKPGFMVGCFCMLLACACGFTSLLRWHADYQERSTSLGVPSHSNACKHALTQVADLGHNNEVLLAIASSKGSLVLGRLLLPRAPGTELDEVQVS